MRELLKMLGYQTPEDVVELIVTGIAVLPALLMLTGHIAAGGLVLWIMLSLLAVVGSHLEPPPQSEDKPQRPHKPH